VDELAVTVATAAELNALAATVHALDAKVDAIDAASAALTAKVDALGASAASLVDSLRPRFRQTSGARAATPGARPTFDGHAPGMKRHCIAYVLDAKRPETRAKRIASIVAAASEGRKPFHVSGPRAGESRPYGWLDAF
jgi:uncharacterized protein YdeI (YjbR/CyaY-like superfamily)